MVMRVYLALLGLGFVALAWLFWAQSANGFNLVALLAALAPLPSTAVVLFVLLHIPAVLTVAQLRKAMGARSGAFGRYPESIVPVLVVLAWLVLGLAFGAALRATLAGLAAAHAIALCYGYVRALTATAKRVEQKIGSPVQKAISHHLRTIYQLRMVFAAVAILMGVVESIGFNLLLAMVLLAGFLAATATAVAYGGVRVLRDVPAQVRANIALNLRAAQAQNPATVAIHYSGPAKSKHSAPVALAKQLAGEGQRVAMICREAHAKPALAKSTAQQFWVAPTIGMVEAFDHPDIRAFFYVNDGEKNGHVARFNSAAHILAASGTVLDQRSLPSNFAMYDAIIAPNPRIAALWRQYSAKDIAAKVYTRSHVPPALLPAALPMSNPPIVALRIEEDAETDALASSLVSCCMNSLAAMRNGAEAWLHLSFPAKPKDRLSAALLREANRAVNDGVQVIVSKNGVAACYNAADIIIARPAESLERLLQTGKPLFWAGPGLPPKGLVSVVEEGALQAALANIDAFRKQAVPLPQRHGPATEFESYGAIIAHVLAQKADR